MHQLSSPQHDSVLVVTPSLGVSPWLQATRRSVEHHCPGSRHQLAVPTGMVSDVVRRFPGCGVAPDAGRSGGMYGAINAGIAAAEWDWTHFTYINDDDLLLPGFDAMASSVLREGFSGIAYGRAWYIDESGRRLAPIPIERNPRRFDGLMRLLISPMVQQGMLVGRETLARLGGFDASYRLSADFDFLARAVRAGVEFRHYGLDVGAFRIQRGQLSKQAANMRTESARIRDIVFPGRVSLFERWRTLASFRVRHAGDYFLRVRMSGFKSAEQIVRGGDSNLTNG